MAYKRLNDFSILSFNVVFIPCISFTNSVWNPATHAGGPIARIDKLIVILWDFISQINSDSHHNKR